MKLLALGGIADHIHILLSLPSTLALAKALQLLKGGSSKWVHETFPDCPFEWQEGYGAFSVGVSQIPRTIAYIKNQETHHRAQTFEAEFVGFLKKHAIEFDERHIWE